MTEWGIKFDGLLRQWGRATLGAKADSGEWLIVFVDDWITQYNKNNEAPIHTKEDSVALAQFLHHCESEFISLFPDLYQSWKSTCLTWAKAKIPDKHSLPEFVTEHSLASFIRYHCLTHVEGGVELNQPESTEVQTIFAAHCQRYFNQHAVAQHERWRAGISRHLNRKGSGRNNLGHLLEDCLQETYQKLLGYCQREKQLICDVADHYAQGVWKNVLTDFVRKDVGHQQAPQELQNFAGDKLAKRLFADKCVRGKDDDEIIRTLQREDRLGSLDFDFDEWHCNEALNFIVMHRLCDRVRKAPVSLDAPLTSDAESTDSPVSLIESLPGDTTLLPQETALQGQQTGWTALWTSSVDGMGEFPADDAAHHKQLPEKLVNDWFKAKVLTLEELLALRVSYAYPDTIEAERAEILGWNPAKSRRRTLSAMEKIKAWLQKHGFDQSDFN